MNPKATVEEVRQHIDDQLAEGRFFSEIYSELALVGVPDKTIRAAATVHDKKNPLVTLLPPDDWRDETMTRNTRAFTFVAILLLALLLSILLQRLS